MALPNPSMSFSPFAILTAEEMNDLVENIEALADGSGQTNVPKIGTIAGSVVGTTGNKTITGVGFAPKIVRLHILPTTSSTAAQTGEGAMTPSAQWLSATFKSATTAGRRSATDGCIAWMSDASTTGFKASYVSMNSDGFTINVSTAASTFDIAYEAYP